MAPTASNMLALGTSAPEFALPDTDGNIVKLSDFDGSRALLVMFVCNHCPFVVHVKDELRQLYDDYSPMGVGFVAISSNDVNEYPDDSPAMMKERSEDWGWQFPYLYDESQEVARAYNAACTPDFFIFDADKKLVYRGQLDDSRPGSMKPVTGSDIRHALEDVLDGELPNPDQTPSVGCSIKWKP